MAEKIVSKEYIKLYTSYPKNDVRNELSLIQLVILEWILQNPQPSFVSIKEILNYLPTKMTYKTFYNNMLVLQNKGIIHLNESQRRLGTIITVNRDALLLGGENE